MSNASVQNQVKESEAVSDGQCSEIIQAAVRGTAPFISRLRQCGGARRAQRFAVGSAVADAVSSALLALLPRQVKMDSAEVEWWQKYYFDNYGISAGLGELLVPAPVEYPTRLLIMHEAVATRCNPIVAVYRKRCVAKKFGWWQFAADLDVAVNHHDRNGTYGIRVRDVKEAEYGYVDEQNLSSQNVWDRGVITTTLPERLIDGDTHLLKKDEHLDCNKITVCAGSKTALGLVPGVRFRSLDGEVYVSCWFPSGADDDLRFRSAIV